MNELLFYKYYLYRSTDSVITILKFCRFAISQKDTNADNNDIIKT